jgi:hypothetical protein
MTTFETRRAELAKSEAAITAKYEARFAELRAELSTAQTALPRELSAVRNALTAREVELEREIATQARTDLDAICASFRDDSRHASKAFAVAWNELRRRCLDELGAEIDAKHVGFAMAATFSDDALAVAGCDDAWSAIGQTDFSLAAYAAAKACVEFPNGSAVVRNALEQLECECERLTKRTDLARKPERARAMRSVATRTASLDAVASYEAQQRLDDKAARENEPQAPGSRIW